MLWILDYKGNVKLSNIPVNITRFTFETCANEDNSTYITDSRRVRSSVSQCCFLNPARRVLAGFPIMWTVTNFPPQSQLFRTGLWECHVCTHSQKNPQGSKCLFGYCIYLSIYKYPCRGESPSRKLVKEKVQSSRVLSIYRKKTCVGAG